MKRFRCLFGPPGEQGSITPIVAVGLLAFVGFLALGIDLGQLYVVRNELQNIADGAALAAAKKLIQDKNGSGVAVAYCDEARDAAVTTAAQNRSLGVSSPIVVTPADVVIGQWNVDAKQFDRIGDSANPILANAVQVTVRRTDDTNPQVTTFLAGAMGGGAKKDVSASATAIMGNAGTSAPDVPLAVPYQYTSGGGVASNGFQRIWDRFAPAPAYAADPQAYRWKDLGGTSLDTSRATFIVPTKNEQANAKLLDYIKGPAMSGKRFPQKKVGDELWPMSEWYWGSYVKPTFQTLKDKFNHAQTPKVNGKWRVTVPVFKTTPVTAFVPQDSWFKLASRLLPGVTQAYACTAYSPAVYNQGFATVDIVSVYVKSDCVTTDGQQVSNANSCRNKCYMDIEVPLNQNTVSTDKGSSPTPFQKDYKDMNPAASEVGVFAAVPRIVR